MHPPSKQVNSEALQVPSARDRKEETSDKRMFYIPLLGRLSVIVKNNLEINTVGNRYVYLGERWDNIMAAAVTINITETPASDKDLVQEPVMWDNFPCNRYFIPESRRARSVSLCRLDGGNFSYRFYTFLGMNVIIELLCFIGSIKMFETTVAHRWP